MPIGADRVNRFGKKIGAQLSLRAGGSRLDADVTRLQSGDGQQAIENRLSRAVESTAIDRADRNGQHVQAKYWRMIVLATGT